jgi:hypothetical protein
MLNNYFKKLQGYGFVMYATTLDAFEVDGKVLSIPGIRDRGYVQIGDVSIKILLFFLNHHFIYF